jgi:hypothetical protein
MAKRDGERDFFKESVDALKAAADAETLSKKSPADKELAAAAVQSCLKAQCYVTQALRSDKINERVMSRARPLPVM